MTAHLFAPWPYEQVVVNRFHDVSGAVNSRCQLRGVESGPHQPSPPARVVQQIGRQVDIRSLFFHRVELGDHRVRERHARTALPASASTRGSRIDPDRQRLGSPFRHRVIAFRQRHRTGRLDSPAGDRKVGDRTPYRLRQKPPVMDVGFGQRGERLEVDLLTRGAPGSVLPDTRAVK